MPSIDDGISGALLWSLRMHRREGGFYWHMEVGTGRNIYKAFHWPGFASGDRYDERAVLKLMRDKAFEIRGVPPPPLERPAPPKLLPIEKSAQSPGRAPPGPSPTMFGDAPPQMDRGRRSRTRFRMPTFSIGRCLTTIVRFPANRIGIESLPAMPPATRSRRMRWAGRCRAAAR